MKYRAVIEKLDWTGKVIRTVSEYEDRFKAGFDPLFRGIRKDGGSCRFRSFQYQIFHTGTSCARLRLKNRRARSTNTRLGLGLSPEEKKGKRRRRLPSYEEDDTKYWSAKRKHEMAAEDYFMEAR